MPLWRWFSNCIQQNRLHAIWDIQAVYTLDSYVVIYMYKTFESILPPDLLSAIIYPVYALNYSLQLHHNFIADALDIPQSWR